MVNFDIMGHPFSVDIGTKFEAPFYYDGNEGEIVVFALTNQEVRCRVISHTRHSTLLEVVDIIETAIDVEFEVINDEEDTLPTLHESLTSMTKKQLIDMANESGIEVKSSSTKAVIIDTIETALASDSE